MRYSENGKSILDYQQQELIASFDVENKPWISLTNTMTLPGRTLAVIQVNIDLNLSKVDKCTRLSQIIS